MPNTAIFSLLPTQYGWVALSCGSTFALHIYQIMTVSKWRKAANISYPAYMASKEEQESSPAAKTFNCAQRAHANTLEILPQMLFGAAFGGLQYPVVAASLMGAWVVGRVLYTYGYVSGAGKRYSYGGHLHLIGALGTLVTSWTVAIQMVLATL